MNKDDRLNIVIIGSGELGSRHLQSLLKVYPNSAYHLVDKSEESIAKCILRSKEIVSNFDCKIYSSLHTLPTKIDLAIIATTSIERKDLVADLCSNSEVTHLILEKFLFPKIEEYKIVKNILDQTSTTTHVNCPRRLFDGYRFIKQTLKGQNCAIKSITIDGGNWNLASNAIHFFDLISYFCDDNVSVEFETMEVKAKENNYKGHFDLTGSISMRFNDIAVNVLCSEFNKNIEIKLQLDDNQVIVADEFSDTVSIDNVECSQKINMLFQSDMTGIVAKELFEYGTCGLIDFNKSSYLHIAFLKILQTQSNINFQDAIT